MSEEARIPLKSNGQFLRERLERARGAGSFSEIGYVDAYNKIVVAANEKGMSAEELRDTLDGYIETVTDENDKAVLQQIRRELPVSASK